MAPRRKFSFVCCRINDMKRIVCLFLAAVLFLAAAPSCRALSLEDDVDRYLKEAPFSVEAFTSLSLGELLGSLWELLKKKLNAPVELLGRIFLSLVAGAAACSFAPARKNSGALETALLLAVFFQGAEPLLELMAKVCESLSGWSDYLAGFVPVFSGVMVTCGQPASAIVYSGMFLAMAFFTSQMMVQVGVPLLQSFLALNTAGGICRIGGIGDVCQTLLKAIRWIIKFSSVLFGSVLSLQTLLSHSADSLAMQTGKFLIGSGIPLVGQTASNALGSVLAGLKLLKSSLGFAAIAVVAASFLPLLAECLLYSLIFNLGAGAAKGLEYPFCAKTLEGMAQTADLCTAMLVFFFMLVVLATSLMILCGGGFV